MDGSMSVVFREGQEGSISIPDEDWYSLRPPECENICFYDMKAGHKADYTAIDGPLVVPVLKPYYNPCPTHEQYPLFCKQMLLSFRPWRQPGDVLQGLQPPADFVPTTSGSAASEEDHRWVCGFEWWVHSGEAPLCIQREHKRELTKAIAGMEAPAAGDGEGNFMEREDELELRSDDDEAQLFRRNPIFGAGRADDDDDDGDGMEGLGAGTSTAPVDWGVEGIPEAMRGFDFEGVGDWLQQTVSESAVSTDYVAWAGGISFSGLLRKQKLAVAVVKKFLEDATQGQLLMHLMGTAGTGKSWTVKAICKMCLEHFSGEDGRPCFVLGAPTGTAAFQINGKTLHSLLKLPFKATRMDDLPPSSKTRLQDQWRGARLLIIDEQSMVGRRMFGNIDRRLRDIMGVDQPFGGLHVILVGDNGQLPPVKDATKFVPKETQAADGTGRRRRGRQATVIPGEATAVSLYEQFRTVVKLDQPVRQSAEDVFYSFLQRLRDGEVTERDWESLVEPRSLERLPAEERASFLDTSGGTIKLISVKEELREYNKRSLQALRRPVARIVAEHNNTAARQLSSDELMGLQPELSLAIGAPVMLRTNAWTEAGLVNGALGTVRAIVYKPDARPPDLPTAVIVEFPHYIGPGWNGLAHHVAISPYTATSETTSGARTRKQLPLILAFGITIHKSQGMTIGADQPIKRAVIDIGGREFNAGLTFVALSRAKTLSGIAFQPGPPFNRLSRISKCSGLRPRLEHDAELSGLAEETLRDWEHLLNDPMFSE